MNQGQHQKQQGKNGECNAKGADITDSNQQTAEQGTVWGRV